MTQRKHTTRGLRLDELREFVPALGALAVGLALTLLVSLLLAHYQQARWDQTFEHRTERWAEDFRDALAAYDRIGRLTATFAARAQPLNDSAFRQFTTALLKGGPPVGAIGWHPALPRGANASIDTPHGPQTVAEAGEEGTTRWLFPLRLAMPPGQYRYGYSPTGVDDPRAAVLARAVESGAAVTAHGVPVPGEPGAASGIVTYYPVAAPDGGGAPAGLVSVGFRPEQLVAGISNGAPGLWVNVSDPSRALPPRALYQGSSAGTWTTRFDASAVPDALIRTFEAQLANLPLQITLSPSRSLLAERETWLPWLTLLGGLIATALATAFLATQARRSQSIERQVSQGTRALLEAQSDLVRNAEARERTLQALSESEARYRLLADNATDVISRLAPDGTLLYVSPAVRTILGYEPEELVGRSVYELLPTFDVPNVRRQTEEALSRPGVYTVAYRLQHAQGHIVWLEVTHRILTDPNTGRPSEVISVSRDISARRDAERALRESEALFRTVFEEARVGMALFSPANGRFLRVNRALCEMLGYSRSELEEKTMAEVTHPADQHISPSEIQQVLGGEKDGFFEEKRYLNRSGGTVWVLGNCNLIRDSDGEARYFIAQFQDISDRKRAEERLTQISHQRDLILNAAAEGIYGVDMDGYTTFVNEAAARLLGFEPAELVGVRMHQVIQAGGRRGGRWEDSRVYASIEDQRTYHVESEQFHDRDGAPLHVQYVVSPIIENGRSTGAVVVFSPLEEWRRPAASAGGD